MITWEAISKAVEPMKTLDFKGKGYATVPERVKAFRAICPGGSIVTEIVSLTDSMVIMKSTVADEDGKVLSTGMAFEKPDSSYINKTSFIENCETSAVGRALGFIALGIDASMCSAEELANALHQQETMDKKPQKPQEPPQKSNAQIVVEWCNAHRMSKEAFGNWRNVALANDIIPDKRVNELTPEELQNLIRFVEANNAG